MVSPHQYIKSICIMLMHKLGVPPHPTHPYREYLVVVCVSYSLSRVRLLVTSWPVAHQAPPSMEFSRQEYRSGLPCPPAGDLPNPEIELGSPSLQVDSLTSEPPGKPLEDDKINK